MWDRRDSFTFLKSLILGLLYPLYILLLGGLSNGQLNKIGSLTQFTTDLL